MKYPNLGGPGNVSVWEGWGWGDVSGTKLSASNRRSDGKTRPSTSSYVYVSDPGGSGAWSARTYQVRWCEGQTMIGWNASSRRHDSFERALRVGNKPTNDSGRFTRHTTPARPLGPPVSKHAPRPWINIFLTGGLLIQKASSNKFAPSAVGAKIPRDNCHPTAKRRLKT